MREEITRDAYGESVARVVAGVVLELLTRGHISRANSLAMFEHGAALLRGHPEVRSVLFDLSKHEGHDPGNVAHAVRWFRTEGARIKRAAIVTRNPAYAALIHVARVMLPRLETAVFASREDALAWCMANPSLELPVRPRTGRHRRSNAA
jgi:hypothetical protein